MPKSDQTPAALEGRKLSVVGQDIKPHGVPRPLAGSNEIVFELTVRKRGESTILKENSPKASRFRSYSFIDLDSQIKGEWLWGFSSFPLDSGSIKVGGAGKTSSHPGQSLEIEGTCLMEIVKGWRGNSLLVHPKDQLLSK